MLCTYNIVYNIYSVFNATSSMVFKRFFLAGKEQESCVGSQDIKNHQSTCLCHAVPCSCTVRWPDHFHSIEPSTYLICNLVNTAMSTCTAGFCGVARMAPASS